jgi:Xaa-Pro dipeptidase
MNGGMGEGLAQLLAAHRTPATAASIDVGRMRRERHQRLQVEMARQEVDAMVLLHAPNVAYATGQPVQGIDVTHAVFQRPVAIVAAGAERPLLLGHGPDDLDVERRPAVCPELDDGAVDLAALVAEVAGAGGSVAVDEITGAMLRTGWTDRATVVDASQVVGAAKLTKTADERACIAEAQRRNEIAMVATQDVVRPGVRRSDVARELLAQLRLLGVEANLIDPIFQPMPRSIADGPRTTTGDVAFPTGVGDPALALGDLVWVDTGIDHLGYASDFGRTWVVGRDPTPDEQCLFERWCSVMVAVLDVLGPGVSGGELCRVATEANDGARPWLPHFYLGHGLGVESAEMPLVGTDLGESFDDIQVLVPGMVLVLEPVIWEDGVGGYRAEEIVAITSDGWEHLGSGHGHLPFTPGTTA